MSLKCLAVSVLLLSCGSHAAAQACLHARQENPLGLQIAQAALREYQEFNGHRINANGYLWKSGAAESETELLHEAESGQADAQRSGRFVWRRVWEYWLALDRHVPGEALSRKIISTPGLLENPDSAKNPTQIRLRDILPSFRAEDRNTDTALRQAAVRAALNDSPWSAAFISYLMDQAHLTNQQFRYSSAHWQYIKAAFEQPSGYVYKACDARQTVPAVGDLLCYSRGAFALKNFAQWHQASQNPNFAEAAHCEVVIAVEKDAKKIELIGGNVLQSVTRRKLKLNAENLISSAHHPERFKPLKNSECAEDSTCRQPNLNVQYWSVLLQLQ